MWSQTVNVVDVAITQGNSDPMLDAVQDRDHRAVNVARSKASKTLSNERHLRWCSLVLGHHRVYGINDFIV